MPRNLQGSKLHYPAVTKDDTAIIEAGQKWSHLLGRQHFIVVSDQRSVAFMLNNRKGTKIKKSKIWVWRMELASFSYNIYCRPGKENVAPDTLTRTFCCSTNSSLTQRWTDRYPQWFMPSRSIPLATFCEIQEPTFFKCYKCYMQSLYWIKATVLLFIRWDPYQSHSTFRTPKH